jgi:hypothetical protein
LKTKTRNRFAQCQIAPWQRVNEQGVYSAKFSKAEKVIVLPKLNIHHTLPSADVSKFKISPLSNLPVTIRPFGIGIWKQKIHQMVYVAQNNTPKFNHLKAIRKLYECHNFLYFSFKIFWIFVTRVVFISSVKRCRIVYSPLINELTSMIMNTISKFFHCTCSTLFN